MTKDPVIFAYSTLLAPPIRAESDDATDTVAL